MDVGAVDALFLFLLLLLMVGMVSWCAGVQSDE
jgi:hypothetical protein